MNSFSTNDLDSNGELIMLLILCGRAAFEYGTSSAGEVGGGQSQVPHVVIADHLVAALD